MNNNEIINRLMDSEQNKIILSEFITQNIEKDNPLCFYHGTDCFVLNTKSEDKKNNNIWSFL